MLILKLGGGGSNLHDSQPKPCVPGKIYPLGHEVVNNPETTRAGTRETEVGRDFNDTTHINYVRRVPQKGRCNWAETWMIGAHHCEGEDQ